MYSAAFVTYFLSIANIALKFMHASLTRGSARLLKGPCTDDQQATGSLPFHPLYDRHPLDEAAPQKACNAVVIQLCEHVLIGAVPDVSNPTGNAMHDLTHCPSVTD